MGAHLAPGSGDRVKHQLLQALEVFPERRGRQDLRDIRKLRAAALRAHDDFAVGEVLLVAELVIRNAAARGIARVETGERMHDRGADVALLRRVDDGPRYVIDEVREVRLIGFAPADPDRRVSRRLAHRLILDPGEAFVLHHRFEERLRRGVRFLLRCFREQVKDVRRNAGAHLVSQVEDLLVRQF